MVTGTKAVSGEGAFISGTGRISESAVSSKNNTDLQQDLLQILGF